MEVEPFKVHLWSSIWHTPRYIISARGIEPNPNKVSTITNMKWPTYVKDIQKLIGCIAALSRFISCLDEKGLPFFKLLKASEHFSWSEEADTAFKQLKLFLMKPPDHDGASTR